MEDQEEGQKQQVNSEMEEVLLLCRKIKIQQRLFCFEFKENCFAQYLLICHNGSSLLVPSNGISCFLDAVDCLSSGFVKQEQRDYDGFSKEKELKIDDKVFCFGIGQKRWGHYMKVWEASASQNNTSSIIIPSGNNGIDGWELFKTTLAEVYKTSRLLCPPLQGQSAPAESSTDAKVNSVTCESAQNLNIESSQIREGSTGEARMMRAGSKRFYFDLGSNKRGHFLKISEVMGANRSSIIIPLSSMQQFHEMVGHFLKCSNKSVTGTNLKQSSGHYISKSKELDAEEDSAPGQEN
ncbi:hypothetical protein AB3S75_022522 [Citrus x aurantiifolia]